MSNENQNCHTPGIEVVFNDSFKVVRKDYFGINADLRYNGGDVEEPYQSAQDSEGNIYIATIQFHLKKICLYQAYRSIFYYQVWT